MSDGAPSITTSMTPAPPVHRRVMVVAGEASGDIYAADVIKAVHNQDPAIRFFGIGGERMREAGCDTLVDSAPMAVMGLVEVFKHLDVIAPAFLKLKKILLEDPPDLLLLVDYPGFNLRLAKIARKAGVPVLYYISPSIWAWKKGRIWKIKKLVDHMALILPFELPYYQQAGIPATYVGHPMADIVQVSTSKADAAQKLGFAPSQRVVGLFPGSRHNEIERMLPTLLEAAELLFARHPDLQFVLPLASTLTEASLAPHLARVKLPITITHTDIHELIRACDAIISVSGTVTLEVALVGTPQVIIYKLAPLTFLLAKRLVKVDHIGLCNIVAGETVARELIQDDASPEMIAAEIDRLLYDEAYRTSRTEQLHQVRQRIGNGGASHGVASRLLQMLTKGLNQ